MSDYDPPSIGAPPGKKAGRAPSLLPFISATTKARQPSANDGGVTSARIQFHVSYVTLLQRLVTLVYVTNGQFYVTNVKNQVT